MPIKPTCEPIDIIKEGHTVYMVLCGDVRNLNGENYIERLKSLLKSDVETLQIKCDNLGQWDSSLLAILYEAIQTAEQAKIKTDIKNLPKNLNDLIDLAFAVDRKPTHQSNTYGFVAQIGAVTVQTLQSIVNVIGFIGEVFTSLLRFLTFQSIMRRVDFVSALNDCGPKAIGIVALISFLVGLILAFVGAVQLQTFGAQIYVASLVTIGMCRIMGAIMVGIIMAGRTGSAYAATIGTMQVNEELDALETMGLSRSDFLVLPRLLALIFAMPILTMLADFMGMIGGGFVGVFLMGLPYQEYYKYALNAFNLKNFMVGIFHGFCFGFIISLCGCYCGLTCGRNADSVGVATTRSVVNAVVWMIVVTGIITVICQEIGV